MKSIHRFITAIMMASMLLPGCATRTADQPISSAATTADWKVGEYTITFRAGPVQYPKSFSSYEISRKFESDTHPSSIAVESTISIDSFRGDYATKPSDHIKFSTSSSGKTLLIVEEVPNDCAPCRNWILVRGEEEGLIHDYLDLPSREVKPGDVFEEKPTVTRVTEHEISFRYSDGVKRTVPVKSLLKADKRPTFPG